MKRMVVTMLVVLSVARVAGAALYLAVACRGGICPPPKPGDPLAVGNDVDGAYSFWLEIPDPDVVVFDGDPVFTKGGNPTGNSWVKAWPEYGHWYEVLVASLDPGNPIMAGDHVIVNMRRVGPGVTALNLYAEDGVTLLDTYPLIPEPATVVLLGVGVVLVRRRGLPRPALQASQ